MQISGVLWVFLVGCFGGLLAELLKWYGLREGEGGHLPPYAKGLFYWAITGLMVLVGGVLAILYGVTPRNALLVVNIGASAPLIVASLARNIPPHAARASAKVLRNLAGR